MAKIKRHDNGEVIYRTWFQSERRTIERAVREGVDLSGAEFFRKDLSGLDLSGMKADHAHFANANLRGAVMVGASARCASFYQAQMSGAIMSGANVSHARFFESDVHRARVDGTNFSGAYFNLKSEGSNVPELWANRVDWLGRGVDSLEALGPDEPVHEKLSYEGEWISVPDYGRESKVREVVVEGDGRYFGAVDVSIDGIKERYDGAGGGREVFGEALDDAHQYRMEWQADFERDYKVHEELSRESERTVPALAHEQQSEAPERSGPTFIETVRLVGSHQEPMYDEHPYLASFEVKESHDVSVRFASIDEAMKALTVGRLERGWEDAGDDMSSNDGRHLSRVELLDNLGNVVAEAKIKDGMTLAWKDVPVMSAEQIKEAMDRVNTLDREASEESRWDNFSTAEGLREQAAAIKREVSIAKHSGAVMGVQHEARTNLQAAIDTFEEYAKLFPGVPDGSTNAEMIRAWGKMTVAETPDVVEKMAEYRELRVYLLDAADVPGQEGHAEVHYAAEAMREWAKENGVEVGHAFKLEDGSELRIGGVGLDYRAAQAERGRSYSGEITYADTERVIQRTEEGIVQHKRVALLDDRNEIAAGKSVDIHYRYGLVGVVDGPERKRDEMQREHAKEGPSMSMER